MNKSQARRKSVQGAGSKSNLSMSTSRTSMSNRRQSRIDRTGLEKSEKTSATKIQVIGDDGRDVTPKVNLFLTSKSTESVVQTVIHLFSHYLPVHHMIVHPKFN